MIVNQTAIQGSGQALPAKAVPSLENTQVADKTQPKEKTVTKAESSDSSDSDSDTEYQNVPIGPGGLKISGKIF